MREGSAERALKGERILSEPLVRFNMDITQLKDYLDNIIQVVNQHAKLLKILNKEVMARTTEKQMADLF